MRCSACHSSIFNILLGGKTRFQFHWTFNKGSIYCHINCSLSKCIDKSESFVNISTHGANGHTGSPTFRKDDAGLLLLDAARSLQGIGLMSMYNYHSIILLLKLFTLIGHTICKTRPCLSNTTMFCISAVMGHMNVAQGNCIGGGKNRQIQTFHEVYA